jgi:DHA1 family chloramphenicol resistance protein-like MFS transporter
LLDAAFGWRAAFWVVALLCLPAFAAVSRAAGTPAGGALSFAVGGTLITRILRQATGAPTMAGSYATAALNVGATAGPVLAGAMNPFRVAAALVAVALVSAVAGRSGRPAGPGRPSRSRRR